jgi:hypothetical protein
VKQKRLVVLGVTQEQHAERCRLFAQWKGFDWPILHDPINLLEAPAVPIVVAIDEHGIVRAIRPRPETFAADFLDKAFADDAPANEPRSVGAPDAAALRRKAEASPSALAWRAVGDALTIWGGAERHEQAIDAYGRALKLDSSDKNALFRLGVAYRMRHESAGRRPGDFQAAVDAWANALALDPNQYIWRRRIEQYGPRLIKPYAFYDWVNQAKREIAARGEQPISLEILPTGAEIASPARDFGLAPPDGKSPDPDGKIVRDKDRLIGVEVAVVPSHVRPGQTARVHITFFPNQAQKAHWNNESTPLRLWVNAASGWEVSDRLLSAPQGAQTETEEVRRLDFEIKAPMIASGRATLSAYALYNVCEEVGGACRFLRQDIPIELLIEE